ncbi:MAG: MFS transporter [Burkholderiaceae bacterium]
MSPKAREAPGLPKWWTPCWRPDKVDEPPLASTISVSPRRTHAFPLASARGPLGHFRFHLLRAGGVLHADALPHPAPEQPRRHHIGGGPVCRHRLGGRVCHDAIRFRLDTATGAAPTLWLAAVVPVLAISGFVLTPSLPWWFAFNFVAGMASGLRWVLAEAVVAEFAPPVQRGRAIGFFETMVGMTFVIGPALLAWIGAQNADVMWLALALSAIGLCWSLLIPALPTAPDLHDAKVGLSGVWHALRAHPLTMAIGLVSGFFESGITSILPLYGVSLGLAAAAAALLVSSSGLGSALTMLPAGLLADHMAHHPQQRFGDAFAARRLVMKAALPPHCWPPC